MRLGRPLVRVLVTFTEKKFMRLIIFFGLFFSRVSAIFFLGCFLDFFGVFWMFFGVFVPLGFLFFVFRALARHVLGVCFSR